MNITEINVGTSVFIDVEREGLYFTLSTKVLDTNNQGVFILPPYNSQGEIQQFKDRDSVYLRLIKDNRVLRWKCTEWKSIGKDTLKMVFLESTEVAESMNKREAFRISLTIGAKIKSIDTGKVYDVDIKDVSLVGIGLHSNQDFAEKSIFDTMIETSGVTLPLRFQIVRKVQLETTTLYGCSIIQSTQELRKYINARQLEELRKRKQFR